MEKFGLDFNPPFQIFWQLSVYWTFKEDAKLLVVCNGAGRKCSVTGRENIEVNAPS